MNRAYLILAILVAASSAHAQQKSITGTWRLDLSETIGLMDNPIRQKFDSLDQSAKTRIETSMADRTFSFLEGGDMTIKWKFQGNPYVSTGTWDVSSETLTMTIGGDIQRFTFNISTGNHLMLQNTIPSGFFSNLYLIWQP